MDLNKFFNDKRGVGVLSTADGAGKVDAAVYSRPHVLDETTVALLMADRRSRANLESNPHAAYLFKADGGYEGIRLYLTRTEIDKDPAAVRRWREMRGYRGPSYADKGKWIVTFRVDEVRPLTGAEE
jgi:hypothetical protein